MLNSKTLNKFNTILNQNPVSYYIEIKWHLKVIHKPAETWSRIEEISHNSYLLGMTLLGTLRYFGVPNYSGSHGLDY